MLGKRVIPTLLCKGRQLYKGVRFAASERSIGNAAAAVRVHAARGVDELCLLDITATAEGRGPNLQLVRDLSEACFIPLTVGGGIRSLDDIRRLLLNGADKVAICTAAAEVPDLIPQAAAKFGGQAIVGVVEHLGDVVMTRCATQQLNSNPIEWAQYLEACGAGEILLASVERDGTLEGYDLDMVRLVSEAVSIPVIASGGAGEPEHMLDAIRAGADAVAAGALFQFTSYTPKGCAQHLHANGIPVRL